MDIVSVIDRCIRALTLLHDGTSRVYQQSGFDQRPGSIADKEILSATNKQILLTAYDQGGVLIEVVADESMAFAKTLTNPVQTIAPWIIARSTIESAALGCWLLDASIDHTSRIARSYALRYEGLLQQEKYARSENQKQIADSVTDRINKTEAQAIALGYPPIQNKKGRCIGIGQAMPSMTDIVNDVLHMQGIYRLLSATVHAHFWALKNLSFDLMPAAQIPPGTDTQSGVKVHLMQKALQPIPVLSVTTTIISCFVRLVWAKFLLFGWDTAELITIFEGVYDLQGLVQRFWR